MLVDGNLDGAISPEELQKVINFVKAPKKTKQLKLECETGWNFTEDFQIEFEDMLSNHTWLGTLIYFNGGAG